MTNIEAVLFDLDGTLVDTAPDMINALNTLLLEEGNKPLPYNSVRNHVSKGGSALVRLGFGADIEEPRRLKLLDRFLNIYSQNICVGSRLFDGMIELLEKLEQQQSLWGVVTNKPGWLTKPLLQQLGLWQRAACVISGDSLPQKKPDPEPLLFACREMGCDPRHTIYIGDDLRDITAGKAAGMLTLVAGYGYINDHEDPASWSADGMIANVNELHAWLN
jgi:phosphoglycolate phosphatase